MAITLFVDWRERSTARRPLAGLAHISTGMTLRSVWASRQINAATSVAVPAEGVAWRLLDTGAVAPVRYAIRAAIAEIWPSVPESEVTQGTDADRRAVSIGVLSLQAASGS